MTKISHIVPSNLLELIDGRDFYMCLANIAIKDIDYANFYKSQVEKGAFVLLDNGAAEKDQIGLQDMWNIINYINPSEIILMDSLLDCDKTIKSSSEAQRYYRDKGYKGQLMFVPQGENFSEWCRCFDTMDLTDISTIGVSKFVTSSWKDSNARFKCIDHMYYSKKDKKQVHLLGCHENIDEISYISNYFHDSYDIRSNDTAIAFIYAKDNQDISKGLNRPNQQINFLHDELDNDQLYLLKKNIFTFDNKVKYELHNV